MKDGGDKHTLARARALRKAMTLPERLLWAALRRRATGARFRAQHPVGPFILDFYCPRARLAVEVDGSQHDFTSGEDQQRDTWLTSKGHRIVRVPARDVLADPDGVAAWVAAQI